MSKKQTALHTDAAPAAIGPYSQAIVSGHTLYASGQVPIDPASGAITAATIEEQTHQALKNVGEILKAANADYDNVVKTTVFITDLNDFATVNGIYAQYFKPPYPARSCVQVAALPKGAKIEIEVVAKLN